LFTVLPTAGVSSGMTLTEIPAVFFLSLSLTLLVQTLSTSSLGISISSAVASGVLLGMAVLGRQSYLLVLPCLLIPLIWDARIWAKNLFLVGVFCAATAAVVAPVFLIWGGLVPPKVAFVGEGISVWNGVLTMGYAGLIGFLIAPDIIHEGKLHLLA